MPPISDPRLLDPAAFNIPLEDPETTSPGDMHLLRLVLELQVDALLVAVQAAAHADLGHSSGRDQSLPWQRWLVEDLDQARSLSAAVLEGREGAIDGLGGGFSNADPNAFPESLRVIYDTMRSLLVEATSRPTAGRFHSVVSAALAHCRGRLSELARYRRAESGPPESGPIFLPGELLG